MFANITDDTSKKHIISHGFHTPHKSLLKISLQLFELCSGIWQVWEGWETSSSQIVLLKQSLGTVLQSLTEDNKVPISNLWKFWKWSPLSQTNQNVICFYFCTILFWWRSRCKAGTWKYEHIYPIIIDVSRNVCNCEECSLIEAMDSVEVDDKQMKDQLPETEKWVLRGYQRKCFEKQLLQLRASLLNTTSLLSPDHSTGFTSNVVKQVVENWDYFHCRRCSPENRCFRLYFGSEYH